MVMPCMVNSWLYVSSLRNVFSGTASWTRRSSASTPPMMKKTKAVTTYRMPIRLWSTVVSHETRTLVAVGLRIRGCRVVTATAIGAPCYGEGSRASPQAPEVLDERFDLILGEVVVRH